jgi:hypothetical protein
MVKKYIEDIDELSRLARETIKAHPRGYVGVVVEGGRGAGKTVFCLKTQREVYQYHYGITRDDAWEKVLDDIIFGIDDIIDMLNNLDHLEEYKHKMGDWWKEQVHICRVWDDAGMHGGKYKYQVDAHLVDFLQQNLDVFRFITTGFYINSPEMENLLKFIRQYHDHTIIKITHSPEGISPYEKVAFFQKWRRLRNRSGWTLVSRPPHQPFSCYLGNVKNLQIKDQWVYDKYEYLKGEAIRKNRGKFVKMMKHAEKSEPDKDPADAIGLDDFAKRILDLD